MYKELSPETDVFFKFMTDNNLLDLDTKPGKSGGGYCTFIPNYKAPLSLLTLMLLHMMLKY